MKIALPLTSSDDFAVHYGAATKFVVYDINLAQRMVLRRLVVVPQDSEPCAWPTLLRAAGVELVLAGGMGMGARHHMNEHGLKVLVGVPPALPEVIVEAWMAGQLTTGDNACAGGGHGQHHEHRDHAHAGRCHCAH